MSYILTDDKNKKEIIMENNNLQLRQIPFLL